MLDQTQWEIIFMDNFSLGKIKNPTIEFKDGRIMPSAHCNVITGEYTLNEDSLEIGQMISTRMYCEDFAKLEDALLNAVNRIKKVRFTAKKIIFYDEDLKIIIRGVRI